MSELIDKSENSESIRDAVSFGKNDEQSEFSFRENVPNPSKGKEQQAVILNKSDEHSEVIPEEK